MNADDDSSWEVGAVRWSPAQVLEDVPVRQGRAPAMTYMDWHTYVSKMQTGMTGEGTFWRCREPHCRRYAGPYRNGRQATEEALDHKTRAHPSRPRATRSRTR